MKKLFVLLASAMVATAVSASAAINVVPKPVKVTVTEQPGCTVSSATPVVVPKKDESLMATAGVYAADASKIFGEPLAVRYGKAAAGAVNLSTDATLGREEYRLRVTADRVEVAGGSDMAVLYGLRTLTQVVECVGIYKGEAALPVMEIEDKPFFEYRGGMLDVCRHFYSVDDVKRYIDILSLHKMNKFHFHLTDDQGWRIEIKRYPELTKVGSLRRESHIGHYREQRWDTKPYGGYYTQDQIRDIVAYAAARHIDVVPEIELPGHAVAALASYPSLGCVGKDYQVERLWGVHKEVFCAGRDATFEFLQNVLAEVIELFPYQYIHIGGDECPKVRWKECPDCQKRIKDNNLKDEHELQSYFVQRIEKWVNDHGRSIIGWDEIMEGGLSKTATVMSWRGSKGGIAAAKMGNRVIMAPNTHCYLDYLQGPKETEPLSIGGNLPLPKVYALDPYSGLDESQRQYIWGVQANLWTEYIGNMSHVEYMLLPRLAAVAEVGWSYPRKDYEDFVRRMQTFRKVYDAYGFNYAKHIFGDK